MSNWEIYFKGNCDFSWRRKILLEKIIKGIHREERCYLTGQKPRNKLIHEQPLGILKHLHL